MNRDVVLGRWIQLAALLRGQWGWLIGDRRSVAIASNSFRMGREQAAYGRARKAAAHKVIRIQRELYRDWKV